MAKKKKYRGELLDELLGGAKTQEEIFGPEGVLKQMTAAIVERALGAELAQHLDSERQQPPESDRNRRNGASGKTLLTEHGPVPIDVPRDRLGTFEPQILPKHARRVEPLDDRILALYARGMSVRDIRAHLQELYGTEVSPELISRVTDAVWDEIREWQSRPLDTTYAVVWLDALFVKMRDQGVVQTKAVYVAIGLRLDGRREVLALSANVRETALRPQFSVEGEQATAARDDINQSSPRSPTFPDGSDNQGSQAALHRRVQEKDSAGSRRLHGVRPDRRSAST